MTQEVSKSAVLVVEDKEIFGKTDPTYDLFKKACKELGDIHQFRKPFLERLSHVVTAIVNDENNPGDIPVNADTVLNFTLHELKDFEQIAELTEGMVVIAKRIRALLPKRLHLVMFLFRREGKCYFFAAGDIESSEHVCLSPI